MRKEKAQINQWLTLPSQVRGRQHGSSWYKPYFVHAASSHYSIVYCETVTRRLPIIKGACALNHVLPAEKTRHSSKEPPENIWELFGSAVVFISYLLWHCGCYDTKYTEMCWTYKSLTYFCLTSGPTASKMFLQVLVSYQYCASLTHL